LLGFLPLSVPLCFDLPSLLTLTIVEYSHQRDLLVPFRRRILVTNFCCGLRADVGCVFVKRTHKGCRGCAKRKRGKTCKTEGGEDTHEGEGGGAAVTRNRRAQKKGGCKIFFPVARSAPKHQSDKGRRTALAHEGRGGREPQKWFCLRCCLSRQNFVFGSAKLLRKSAPITAFGEARAGHFSL
jgi:hypothetical protein